VVLDRVRATGLLVAGEPVLVLLSGGRDSVCLLDCAVALGCDVSALHVNYGLRDGADEDEAFCRQLCSSLGVPLDVHAPGAPIGNLQAWARDERLGHGRRLARDRGALLATGHTATDQAETVLYRLAASPGRRALLGMSPRDGELVRPLLAVSRAETAQHNTARGLAWREDPTNADTKRGRIRALLDDLHPAAEENITRTAELLREESLVLTDVVRTALAGRDVIPLSELAAMPPALARLVVRELAEGVSERQGARAAARLDEILALQGALDLGDGVRAVVEDGILKMVPTPPLPSHA
jgi:tRNA(Ile)-lysidine synthase